MERLEVDARMLTERMLSSLTIKLKRYRFIVGILYKEFFCQYKLTFILSFMHVKITTVGLDF